MRAKEFRKLIVTTALDGAAVEPRCPHAEQCGGCAFQHRAYADQVAAKSAALRLIWTEVVADQQVDLGAALPALVEQLVVVPSPDPFEYRTRMDYVATKGRFGLRMPGRFNYIVELETCHHIPPVAFAAAKSVWLHACELGLPDYNLRSHEGFLRYVVVRRSPQNQFLLAAVTAAGRHDAAMEQLAEQALQQPGVVGFHWLLNDTLTDLSFGSPVRHWGVARLPMQVAGNTFEIGPNTFFQNNVHLLVPLLDAVTAATTAAQSTQVADLYGGVGTIALHIAPHVGQVTSVESVPESAMLAQHNATRNNVTNVVTVTADVLPFLREQPVGAFDVVVADPPRVGMEPDVCAELLRIAPRRIVYVSCNPLTQREDVRCLAPHYRLTELAGYDMFPHTPHVEVLGILDRV